MIRDRIVVGIRDSTLSERLQMDPDLTLEKAKKLVRQREAVHEHQQFLTGKASASEGVTLEAVSKYSGAKQVNKRPPGGPIQPPSRVPQQRRHQQICSHCGKGAHSRQACPAKDAACHKCNKKGHYSSMCLTKSISNITEKAVSEDANSLETAYQNNLEEQDSTQSAWTCHIELNGKTTQFKI